jgi:O-antigen/teichoic acid export membrane protein
MVRLLQRHRALLATVGASFVLFGFQALQGVLLARTLGPEARGHYNTAVFYAQSLLYAGLIGLPFALQRRAALACSLAALSGTAVRAGLVAGMLTAAAVALLAWIGLPAEKQFLAPLCALAAATLPLQHVRIALQAVDRGGERFTRYNTSELVQGAALPLLLLPVLLLGIDSIELIVGLTVAAAAAGLVYRLAAEDRGGISWVGDPPVRTLMREGLPFAFAKGATDLLNRLDGLFMLWLASFTVQGLYAAAVPAVYLLAVAPTAVATFTFNSGAKSQRLTVGRLAAVSAAAVVIQTVGAAIYALALPQLIVLVFGDDFRGAVPLALALLPSRVVAGCGIIAGGYLRGRNKSHLELRARLAGAAAMAACVLAFWPALAEFAIPWAALVGQSVACVMITAAVFLDALASPRAPTQSSPMESEPT